MAGRSTRSLEGMPENRHRLADRLESVLAGTEDLAALLRDPITFDPSLEHCWANLHHFLSDEDIRAKDPEYRTMQESEMRKLIGLLRSDASPEKLRYVTFLGRSRD